MVELHLTFTSDVVSGTAPPPEVEKEARTEKPLANACIHIRREGSSNVSTTCTDDKGDCVAELDPGQYELEATTTSDVHDNATIQFTVESNSDKISLHVHYHRNQISLTIPCAQGSHF